MWERLMAVRRESGENLCRAAVSLCRQHQRLPGWAATVPAANSLSGSPIFVHTHLLSKFPAPPMETPCSSIHYSENLQGATTSKRLLVFPTADQLIDLQNLTMVWGTNAKEQSLVHFNSHTTQAMLVCSQIQRRQVSCFSCICMGRFTEILRF